VLHPYRPAVEIVRLLEVATAGQLVHHGEIERAVERSAAVAWRPGSSTPLNRKPVVRPWPAPNAEQIEAIVARGGGLVDLWESSPLRFDDDSVQTEHLIDLLFPGNPLLCCGMDNSRFRTQKRSQWRGELSAMQLLVPSPMSRERGLTQEGRLSAHSLDNTGPRRFLVIECDFEPEGASPTSALVRELLATGLSVADICAAILLHLAAYAPLAMVLTSGGKSLHGWFPCAGQPEDMLRRFMAYAVTLGADPATWTLSQFVRMPDGRRDNGNRQTVYYFNPGVIR